jgi:hypothetical protein
MEDEAKEKNKDRKKVWSVREKWRNAAPPPSMSHVWHAPTFPLSLTSSITQNEQMGLAVGGSIHEVTLWRE